ncbi:MAG: hypothetical protein EBU90_03295 [Proteobacteria bacterium]|nr:hypothetical protein [Pseudomonadota bacterium]NBP13352.1 hypothetical protein [bacterium]
MTRDAKLIAENYSKIFLEKGANPTGAGMPEGKRLKDINSFTSNLVAIDAFEDKTNELFNTAVKTGFFTQAEAAQAKQIITGTISGFLLSLVSSTEIKSPNQLQQMKKAIADKITGVDVKPVLAAIDKMTSAMAPSPTPATTPSTPTTSQPSAPTQPVQATTPTQPTS